MGYLCLAIVLLLLLKTEKPHILAIRVVLSMISLLHQSEVFPSFAHFERFLDRSCDVAFRQNLMFSHQKKCDLELLT